jgi:hypothetical protein
MTALMMLGLMRVLGTVLDTRDAANANHAVLEESRYALDRMVRAVSKSNRLLVPLPENPATSHSESIRDPGVLAVTLDHTRDLDGDGFPDLLDWLGEVSTDLGFVVIKDFQLGIAHPASPDKRLILVPVNPFAHPTKGSKPIQATDESARPETTPLELRGVIVAGPESIANLNGELLAIGETSGDYQLARVDEGSATFVHNGELVTLRVKEEGDGDE